MFLTFFDHPENVVEGQDYDYRAEGETGSTGITWHDDNSFEVFGDFEEHYDMNIISLSAGWQANTYKLTYYFSDVNSIKNSDNNNRIDPYKTTSPIETISVNNVSVAGSSLSTPLTMTLVFDHEYDYPEFALLCVV